MHITTVGFDKAKARMNSPANSQKKTKSFFGKGGNPQACIDGSECNVQRCMYKNNSDIQTNGTYLILLNEPKFRQDNFSWKTQNKL